MSLALIEGYSSAEEEDDERLSPSSSLDSGDDDDDSGDDNDDGGARTRNHRSSKQKPSLASSTDPTRPPSNSLLPSALAVFAEVTGPPEFLKSHVAAEEEPEAAPGVLDPRRRNRRSDEKRDFPAGVVVEAKAQLVGIRDRVRSDVDGTDATSAAAITSSTEGRRIISASNPDAKDAAELLRMCLQCGIPKTYSHARGMVCPVCSDRPPTDPSKESEKKKGSTIKDKEKSKRMRGQSSHSAWKSETEMQLRQQFD